MRALDVLRIPALAAMAMSLANCAFLQKFRKDKPELESGDTAPTANVVSTTPAPSTAANPENQAAPTRPAPVINDGLRLPDMLALPSERDMRKPATPPPAQEGSGVTARPPVSD
jgi:hypothetical protein